VERSESLCRIKRVRAFLRGLLLRLKVSILPICLVSAAVYVYNVWDVIRRFCLSVARGPKVILTWALYGFRAVNVSVAGSLAGASGLLV